MASVSVSGGVATYAGADPTYLGVYLNTIRDVAGTVAANNFMTLFNPSGSGRVLTVLSVTPTEYSVNSVTASTSLEVWRISAHSGGTLLPAANTNRLATTMPNPIGESRTGNPTVTTVGTYPLIAWPPAVGTGAQSNTVQPVSGASFLLLPGEGVVFLATAGDVDQRRNIQIVWSEAKL